MILTYDAVHHRLPPFLSFEDLGNLSHLSRTCVELYLKTWTLSRENLEKETDQELTAAGFFPDLKIWHRNFDFFPQERRKRLIGSIWITTIQNAQQALLWAFREHRHTSNDRFISTLMAAFKQRWFRFPKFFDYMLEEYIKCARIPGGISLYPALMKILTGTVDKGSKKFLELFLRVSLNYIHSSQQKILRLDRCFELDDAGFPTSDESLPIEHAKIVAGIIVECDARLVISTTMADESYKILLNSKQPVDATKALNISSNRVKLISEYNARLNAIFGVALMAIFIFCALSFSAVVPIGLFFASPVAIAFALVSNHRLATYLAEYPDRQRSKSLRVC